MKNQLKNVSVGRVREVVIDNVDWLGPIAKPTVDAIALFAQDVKNRDSYALRTSALPALLPLVYLLVGFGLAWRVDTAWIVPGFFVKIIAVVIGLAIGNILTDNISAKETVDAFHPAIRPAVQTLLLGFCVTLLIGILWTAFAFVIGPIIGLILSIVVVGVVAYVIINLLRSEGII